MTVTLTIKDENLDTFWQTVQEQGWLESDRDVVVPQWHIDEVLRRETIDQGPSKPWAEVRKQFIGKGLKP